MPSLTTTRALYHHCQDTDTNCGRASAQMIISSLVQSPAPPPSSTPVPVTQDTLQCREPESSDTVTTPQWFTHPDELLILMRDAPEYVVAYDWDWRLANHPSLIELLATVVVALRRGMPSIININGWDHWVVVVGADVDANGQVQVLKMRDPLPVDRRPHTYIDGCNDGNNGESYGQPWELAADELASYQLAIGNVPPPNGMTNYEGRYLAIVHGQTVRPDELRDLSKRFLPMRPFKRPGPPPELDPAVLRAELTRKAHEWNVQPLAPLLESNAPAVPRAVYDIKGMLLPYSLFSMFNTQLEYGAVGVFRSNGSLARLQFFKDPAVHESLHRAAGQRLYWTKEWLPSLASPFFPFLVKIEQNQARYTRVFDGFDLSGPLPPA